MKRNLLILLVVVMMVATLSLLAGCGGEEATTISTAAPVTTAGTGSTGDTTATTASTGTTAASGAASQVIVAIAADPGDLGPFVGMSLGRIGVLNTMYEFLLSGKTPVIAESFESTGDTSCVVKIRSNIKDSAGNAVTAADVAWSYTTAMAAGNLRPLGDVASVTAKDDTTVEFTFKKALGGRDVEKVLGECPIVSQKAYETSADKFATKPISTSAYVVTESVPGSTLTFEKNPNYWQTDPATKSPFATTNVDKIIFQVISEAAQHSIALETGSADISGSISGADVSRFENNPDFLVTKLLDNLTQCLNFNGSEGSPFTKLELRQAVAYAIDKNALGEAAAGKNAFAPAHTLGNRNFNGYLEKWDSEPYYDYDLAKAKELFAASGAQSGMTARLLTQSDPKSGLMAQVIQAQLAEIGITVEINSVETAVYNQSKYDPAAWDLLLDATAGGDQAYSPWALLYAADRYNGTTSNWFKDDKLQQLLSTASSEAGFNPENLDAFVQYDRQQVYALGLLSWQNIIVSVSGVTKIYTDERGQIIPGACEYAPDFK
jgi:ABC-type transport system substrate-binding protein